MHGHNQNTFANAILKIICYPTQLNEVDLFRLNLLVFKYLISNRTPPTGAVLK